MLLDSAFSESRRLTDGHPRRAYAPSKDTSVSRGLHFGQRKLLLSEVEFLTFMQSVNGSETRGGSQHSAAVSPPRSPNTTLPLLVVYAGAACGSHLPILFALFPSVHFVLIDPMPFCDAVKGIYATGNSAGTSGSQAAADVGASSGPIVELIEGYCDDVLCTRLRTTYAGRFRIVLVSDIRSGSPSGCASNKEVTAIITRDNELQKGWLLALGARAGMLKFHPPYPPQPGTPSDVDDTPVSITYLSGVCLFGVWAPKSSTEVRLVVLAPDDDHNGSGGDVVPWAEQGYHCRTFEEQLYHYNTDQRYAKDVEAERTILERYGHQVVRGLSRTDLMTRDALEGLLGGAPQGGAETPRPVVAGTDIAVRLSAFISRKLHMEAFVPLNRDFSEGDARLLTLILRARVPVRCFAEWRPFAADPCYVMAGATLAWETLSVAEKAFWHMATPVRLKDCYPLVSRPARPSTADTGAAASGHGKRARADESAMGPMES